MTLKFRWMKPQAEGVTNLKRNTNTSFRQTREDPTGQLPCEVVKFSTWKICLTLTSTTTCAPAFFFFLKRTSTRKLKEMKILWTQKINFSFTYHTNNFLHFHLTARHYKLIFICIYIYISPLVNFKIWQKKRH